MMGLMSLYLPATAGNSTCVLKIGYRTNERPPNIARAPDNSGLYLDLYQKAAEMVGCELQVVRLPKNKVIILKPPQDAGFRALSSVPFHRQRTWKGLVIPLRSFP
jgi:hypothetical protein